VSRRIVASRFRISTAQIAKMAVLRLPAFLSRIAKEVGKLHAHRGKASEAAFLRNPIA
jgi:hypothetical protein